MNATNPSEKNVEEEDLISGPHWEPPEVANATKYWRCEDCKRESVRRKDLDLPAFHAEGCALR